jgi:DNA-directed RNA polymerase subunit RPC12/RpoP
MWEIFPNEGFFDRLVGRTFPEDSEKCTMEKIKCEYCGSERCAKILYGRIKETEQLRDDLAAGKVVLGGCMVDDWMPEWRCLNCGEQWRTITRKNSGIQ